MFVSSCMVSGMASLSDEMENLVARGGEFNPYEEEQTDAPGETADEIDEEEVTAIHKIVWLAQGLGIAVPPIPEIYIEEMQEFSTGLNALEDDAQLDKEVEMVFASDQSLALLQTKDAIASELANRGWPKGGMTLGFSVMSGRGCWFYTLIGEQQILVISMYISFHTETAIEVGKAMASMANILLEEHLLEEVNAARALSDTPTSVRRVVSYSNDSGLPVEMGALWSQDAGLAEFKPSFGVFTGRPVGGEADDDSSDTGVIKV